MRIVRATWILILSRLQVMTLFGQQLEDQMWSGFHRLLHAITLWRYNNGEWAPSSLITTMLKGFITTSNFKTTDLTSHICIRKGELRIELITSVFPCSIGWLQLPNTSGQVLWKQSFVMQSVLTQDLNFLRDLTPQIFNRCRWSFSTTWVWLPDYIDLFLSTIKN